MPLTSEEHHVSWGCGTDRSGDRRSSVMQHPDPLARRRAKKLTCGVANCCGNDVRIFAARILIGDPDLLGSRRRPPHCGASPRVALPRRTSHEQQSPTSRKKRARNADRRCE